MKIEVNLESIFCRDEETLNDALKREILNAVLDDTEYFRKNAQEVLREKMKLQAEKIGNEIINEMSSKILDHEFIVCDYYGREKEKWTLRHKILDVVEKNCEWKTNGYYKDAENMFTKSIQSVAKEKFNEFQSLWLKTVDSKFMADCMEYASKKFAERMK